MKMLIHDDLQLALDQVQQLRDESRVIPKKKRRCQALSTHYYPGVLQAAQQIKMRCNNSANHKRGNYFVCGHYFITATIWVKRWPDNKGAPAQFNGEWTDERGRKK